MESTASIKEATVNSHQIIEAVQFLNDGNRNGGQPLDIFVNRNHLLLAARVERLEECALIDAAGKRVGWRQRHPLSEPGGGAAPRSIPRDDNRSGFSTGLHAGLFPHASSAEAFARVNLKGVSYRERQFLPEITGTLLSYTIQLFDADLHQYLS